MENRQVILNRQQLYDLAWSKPVLQLIEQYKISYGELKKVYKKLNIPVPKAGHWSKIRHGKTVAQQILPDIYEGKESITLILRREDETGTKFSLSPQLALKNKIHAELKDFLKVQTRLTNPDPLVLATQKELSQMNKSYRFEGMIRTDEHVLNIRVTPKLVGRALRFMDTLIKALRLRGHDLKVDNGRTAMMIMGQQIVVSCQEKTNKVIVSEKSWNRTVYRPNGILGFKVEGYYGSEWTDNTKPLEEYIPTVIARMELKVAELHAIWRKNEERQAKLREQEWLVQELSDRKQSELAAFKSLLHEALRFNQTQMLRNYIAARESVIKRDLESNNKEWIEWASKKANWYDPFLNAEDELLQEVDKNTLLFT